MVAQVPQSQETIWNLALNENIDRLTFRFVGAFSGFGVQVWIYMSWTDIGAGVVVVQIIERYVIQTDVSVVHSLIEERKLNTPAVGS